MHIYITGMLGGLRLWFGAEACYRLEQRVPCPAGSDAWARRTVSRAGLRRGVLPGSAELCSRLKKPSSFPDLKVNGHQPSSVIIAEEAACTKRRIAVWHVDIMVAAIP